MSELAAVRENGASLMKRSWLAFLESRGGKIVEDQRTVFPVICFEGKDVKSFLQSQLTCDINNLENNKFLFGAYCNPKGRVLATFRLCTMDDFIYMVCNHSVVTSLLNRLKMFVLRADVTFHTCHDLAVVCHNTVADLPHSAVRSQSQTGLAWPNECQGDLETAEIIQLMVTPVDDAVELIEKSEKHVALLDSDWWNLLQIRHGVPNITATNNGLFTPQNLNLDLISGVSFTKGCYPGQEIVARLRYLGRVKQRLVRGIIHGESEIRVGQPVAMIDTTGSKAGAIVNATTLEEFKTECLLSVHDFLNAENIYCYYAQPSKQITTLPLPYALQ